MSELTDNGQPLYVLSVDPGRTSGVVGAYVSIVDDPPTITVADAGLARWDDRFDVLTRFLTQVGPGVPDVVIVEAYRLFAHMSKAQIGSEFEAVQVIGNVQALCEGLVDITYIMPSDKGLVQVLDEHADQIGNSPHVKDAYKLLRYWTLTKGRRLAGA